MGDEFGFFICCFGISFCCMPLFYPKSAWMCRINVDYAFSLDPSVLHLGLADLISNSCLVIFNLLNIVLCVLHNIAIYIFTEGYKGD